MPKLCPYGLTHCSSNGSRISRPPISPRCQQACYLWCTRERLLLSSLWRHQMERFSALKAICAGNSPVIGEFPTQRPVTLSFDVFFHLRLNKQLSKQSRCWWFETLLRPLWRHCNVCFNNLHDPIYEEFVKMISYIGSSCKQFNMWSTKML